MFPEDSAHTQEAEKKVFIEQDNQKKIDTVPETLLSDGQDRFSDD